MGLVPPGLRLAVLGLEQLDALLALARAGFDYNTPTRRELRYFLTQAHALFLGFFERESGALLGYTLIELNRKTLSMYANTTCVAEHARGKGIGKSAFALRTVLAQRLGYRSVRTHIAVDNGPSLHLALKFGYQVIETLPEYYDNGRSCHVLRLDLTGAGAPAHTAPGG